MKCKILLISLLVLVIILSGCIGQPDATGFVKTLPDVQDFLVKNPDADIKAEFLSKELVKTDIEKIRVDCGQQMQEVPYWHITITKGAEKVEVYLDETGRKALCTIKFEAKQTNNEEELTIALNKLSSEGILQPKFFIIEYIPENVLRLYGFEVTKYIDARQCPNGQCPPGAIEFDGNNVFELTFDLSTKNIIQFKKYPEFIFADQLTNINYLENNLKIIADKISRIKANRKDAFYFDIGKAGYWCSNSEYLTKDMGYNEEKDEIRYRNYMILDDQSREKLINNLETKGSSALQGISDLTCLAVLDLTETSVSDLSPLSNLTKLKALELGSTSVSDITPLSNLTELQSLNLTGTSVSNLFPLFNLTNLTHLMMMRTPVSDLSPISNLKKLETLQLAESDSVSNISALANVPRLKSLTLYGTSVSDITPLENLKNLERLDLRKTLVSAEDCEALKGKLPNTEIKC